MNDDEHMGAQAQPAPRQPSAKLIKSEELFGDCKTVLIQHQGEYYRLLITRNDKLMLQK